MHTLFGSRHANMKELRFDAADGVWRFYRRLIDTADKRFDSHLKAMKEAGPTTGARNPRKRRP